MTCDATFRKNYSLTTCSICLQYSLVLQVGKETSDFDQTCWLEERQRFRRRTVEDGMSVSQERQSVKQIEDIQSRLMNRKYNGATSSWQSRYKTVVVIAKSSTES